MDQIWQNMESLEAYVDENIVKWQVSCFSSEIFSSIVLLNLL